MRSPLKADGRYCKDIPVIDEYLVVVYKNRSALHVAKLPRRVQHKLHGLYIVPAISVSGSVEARMVKVNLK